MYPEFHCFEVVAERIRACYEVDMLVGYTSLVWKIRFDDRNSFSSVLSADMIVMLLWRGI